MTEIMRERATGPAAWKGGDFPDDGSWITRLTTMQVGEIETALDDWKRRKLSIEDMEPHHVRLPSLEPLFAEVRRELVRGRGFALIRGLPVHRWSVEETGLVYWALGMFLGDGVTQSSDSADLLGYVTDRGLVYGEGNNRAYRSRARLLFHCDQADLVGLLCCRKARSGGESYISSTVSIYNEILEHHPEYLETLYEGFPYSRNGEEGPGEQPFTRRIPVYTYSGGDLSCRYTRRYMELGAKISGHPLSDLQREALDFFDRTAWRSDIALQMPLEPGDIQFLNNYLVVHTREEFEDWPDPERRRLLLRLWLRLDGIRDFGGKEAVMRDEFLRYGKVGLTSRDLRRLGAVSA